jgi:hypothetical protein
MNVTDVGGLDNNDDLYYYGSITNESEGKINLCSVDGTVTTNYKFE